MIASFILDHSFDILKGFGFSDINIDLIKGIGAITGLLLLHEKDTKLRKFLDKVLGRDHCTDAISKEDLFFYETMK